MALASASLLPPMQRFLIGLTLVLLLVVSIAIGIAVARLPEWRHSSARPITPRATPAALTPDPSREVSIGWHSI